MKMKLSELAGKLGLTLMGQDRDVSGVGTLESAGPEDVTFLGNPKYEGLLAGCKAAAVICTQEHAAQVASALVSVNPYLDFARLLALITPQQGCLCGVSDEASVHPEASVDASADVYPFAFVARGASIGPRSRVFPGCYVGEDCIVGADCTLYPNVTLMAGTVLGERVMIHSGAVLGSDGFGYVETPLGREKIPQVGAVLVADDVEIGANTTIDRAMLEKTIIGSGTKIDNLVQIGHNCTFGRNCTIVSQVGVAGSCTVGNNVIIAGKAGLNDHLDIGDDVLIGPKCGVRLSIPAGKRMGGHPAMEYTTYMRHMSLAPQIPDLFKRVKKLEKELAALRAVAEEGDK
ncbi:MAG: UDP-3-O-(3-hydroxymyristoyl)glucosamine N-acyltransferase [Proteobacteria bacterium]|nr:UDP-3-O-(3-hydroxymyristoyl)glucosamine N-acyltransferase [Pseudomonadota bacterium]